MSHCDSEQQKLEAVTREYLNEMIGTKQAATNEVHDACYFHHGVTANGSIAVTYI
jgi:hypothetical protein